MSQLGPSAYLAHIRRESARFREVLAACPPDARVPSCPDWDAADLLWHLGEVQHWWHHVVSTRPAPPADYPEPERPTSYDALLGFFDEWHGRFVEVLEAADPADAAWSWSSRPQHQDIAFTYRRQAHEALIHRLDAELAAGDVTPLPTDLAADGVEEALDVMYGGLPAWATFTPDGRFAEFRISDADASVWVELGTFSGTAPDGTVHADEPDLHLAAAPGRPADLVYAGTAEALDGWLWHRRDGEVEASGDPGTSEHVGAVLGQPIN